MAGHGLASDEVEEEHALVLQRIPPGMLSEMRLQVADPAFQRKGVVMGNVLYVEQLESTDLHIKWHIGAHNNIRACITHTHTHTHTLSHAHKRTLYTQAR